MTAKRILTANTPAKDAPARFEQDGHVLTFTPRPSRAERYGTVYDVALNGVMLRGGIIHQTDALLFYAKLVTAMKAKA